MAVEVLDGRLTKARAANSPVKRTKALSNGYSIFADNA